jgi:hypothetical protein
MYLIGKKRVEIISKQSHTYLVRYVATGIESSVSRKYVKWWEPKVVVSEIKTTKNNNQLNLFN